MNKLVYICVPNELVIGQVVLNLLIKRLAVAMMNKTVGPARLDVIDDSLHKLIQTDYKSI
jgi:hypothetical protein